MGEIFKTLRKCEIMDLREQEPYVRSFGAERSCADEADTTNLRREYIFCQRS